MELAVLGAWNIGGTLGKKWARAGHTVVFGVRNVNNPEVQDLVKSLGANASVETTANAIGRGEVIVFAIPGAAMDETITTHARALDGKIIIDTANRMGSPVMNSAATFAAQTPKAQVFRAFNSLGWENFENPQFGAVQADLFYCGPDSEARAKVEKLIEDVGLRPMRVGGLESIQLVDAVAGLWFAMVRGQGLGRRVAFKVLTP